MEGHIHGSAWLIQEDWPPARAWRDEANQVLARVNQDPSGFASALESAEVPG
jgi:hypothetical protein